MGVIAREGKAASRYGTVLGYGLEAPDLLVLTRGIGIALCSTQTVLAVSCPTRGCSVGAPTPQSNLWLGDPSYCPTSRWKHHLSTWQARLTEMKMRITNIHIIALPPSTYTYHAICTDFMREYSNCKDPQADAVSITLESKSCTGVGGAEGA